MKLKFRAWYVLAEEMIDEILMISFVRKEIIGKFSDGSTSVPLKFDNGDGTTCENTVTIYHNQNPIALAECEADDGNGGYYYSVGSLVIGKIHFPIVEA